MAWNPGVYNQFKSERFAPFFDLLALVEPASNMRVIDLGCGTGELTRKLSDAMPGSTVLGIDSSREMLADSKAFVNAHLQFEQRSIEEQVKDPRKWDLVFSNAAIHWVDDHATLLPKLAAMVNPGGQLAIQIPNQQQNAANLILAQLAGQSPYKESLKNWNRPSPVLSIDEYARLLFSAGAEHMNLFEKIYPIIADDSIALYDWVSGTALIPYLEKMAEEHKPIFIADFKETLKMKFPESPLFYPFRRILMQAKF